MQEFDKIKHGQSYGLSLNELFLFLFLVIRSSWSLQDPKKGTGGGYDSKVEQGGPTSSIQMASVYSLSMVTGMEPFGFERPYFLESRESWDPQSVRRLRKFSTSQTYWLCWWEMKGQYRTNRDLSCLPSEDTQWGGGTYVWRILTTE